MCCGSCGSTDRVQKLKSGLYRCQSCFDNLQIVCPWPRDSRVDAEPTIDARPWRKMVEQWQSDTEWYR